MEEDVVIYYVVVRLKRGGGRGARKGFTMTKE